MQASIDYVLGRRLERLELIGSALNGTVERPRQLHLGNALNNVLNGGTGRDSLQADSGMTLMLSTAGTLSPKARMRVPTQSAPQPAFH